MAAVHSPSQGRLDNVPPSSSSPASFPCADQSDLEYDFSSSDDEAGVFFGAHQPVERKIVAALSRSIPPSPAQADLSAAATPPRRSSLINRVKKRDSREFLRRKTLLLGTPERPHEALRESPEKSISTPERDVAEPSYTEFEAGPSTPTPVYADDVSADLESLRLDTFPPSDGEQYLSEPHFHEEDDKENSAVPEEWIDDDDYQEYVPEGTAPPAITVGYREGQYEHELSAHLDMGNLSILDIDDPECAPTEMGNDTGGSALLGTSFGLDQTLNLDDLFDRDSDDGLRSVTNTETAPETNAESDNGSTSFKTCSASLQAGLESYRTCTEYPYDLGSDTGATIAHEDAPLDDEASFAIFSDHSDAFELGQRPQLLPRSLLDDTVDQIKFTPLKPNGHMEAVNEDDVSDASDMDSPMARGPVMIPVFSVASPPFARQTMAMDEDDMLPHPAADDAIGLPPLDSPAVSALQPSFAERHSSTPIIGRKPSTPPSLGSGARSRALQQSASKRTTAQPLSAHNKKLDERIEARRAAAQEQLDSIFSSRTMAPSRDLAASTRPIRSPATAPAPPAPVHVRSAQATPAPRAAAAASQALKPTKLLAKSPSKLPVATRAKPATLAASLKASSNQGVLHAPRPVSAAKTVRILSGSTKATSTASSAPAAPLKSALKRPVGAASTARAPSTTRTTRPQPSSAPAARPVASLKRPYSATISSSARTAASAGGASRPALGLPSRLIRDPVSGTAVMATSAVGGGGLGPLSRSVRSPVKVPSPTRPTLGRPSRPTGMTPVAQRTMQTPQHGLTPSRAQKLGTPSRPAATPLRLRQLAMAPVPESKSSPTPVRGEQPPPSPAKRLATPTHSRQANSTTAPKSPSADEPAHEPEPAQAHARLPSPGKALSPSMPPSPPAPSQAEGSSTLAASPKPVNKAAEDAVAQPTETPAQDDVSPPANDDGDKGDKDVEMSDPESTSEPATESEPEQSRNAAEQTSADEPAPAPTAEPEADKPGSRRSARATRTPARLSSESAPAPRPRAAPVPSIAPDMTESELKRATTRNTARNQVYLCTIDRQIVRVEGPRPPSPTSSIRTTADREREDRKAGREARARRRQRGSMGESETEDEGTAVEQIPFERRARGDDEEFETPRPVKRAKLDNGKEPRFVHWDTSATVIHGGLSDIARAHPAPPSPNRLKGCFTPKGKYPLDKMGNAIDRPVEKLKRSTITVRAMFYEGEEPAPFSYNVPPPSLKRKGKKK